MEYRVIKDNNLFLLTDQKGDIPKDHPYGLGLYKNDTRFLCRFDLKINGEEPILLSSEANKSTENQMVLTNPHMERDGDLILWRESIEIIRKRFIYEDVLYETVTLKNYYPKALTFTVSLHTDADFADMFIVRGFQSGKVGNRTGQGISNRSIAFHYVGSDKVNRTTSITWDRDASDVTENGIVTFNLFLDHAKEESITFRVNPIIDGHSAEEYPLKEAYEKLEHSTLEWNEKVTQIETDHKALQKLVDRGISDLRVLLTDIGHGSFPVAGLPWFGVPFGRDSLIAALQMISFNPEVAKGTLKTMAHYQGTKHDSWRDEQPGKIMHEIRYGELATTNQIPFTPYYGSIDSTPLFLMLLVEYVKWTNDFSIVHELMPNVIEALNWIDQYGDRDGDGLVEYHQESSKGIANQGWKDSGDSIVHRDGEYAETPIALAEVQGYVYQAKSGLAELFDHMGEKQKAFELRSQSRHLKEAFHHAFWMEDVGYYAIALDKNKKQVGTITSNPGHLLLSGILEDQFANSVARVITSESMFSGFGIRTMAEGEAGYNPMSYHDGSIWPHDNSLITLGLSKLGKSFEAQKVMNGMIQAAGHFDYDRLPELFCGYDDSSNQLIKYPVACSPQAWAAGTPLTFIQSILGINPDALKGVITIEPHLIDSMNKLTIHHMRVGEGKLSLSITKDEQGTHVNVLENSTGMEIVKQGVTFV